MEDKIIKLLEVLITSKDIMELVYTISIKDNNILLYTTDPYEVMTILQCISVYAEHKDNTTVVNVLL